MVEYAFLTAGNVLMPLQVFADRVMRSAGTVEVLMVVAGGWALWRVLAWLVSPRTR